MLTKDFYFDLPEELIAQHPSDVRGEDKLMVLDRVGYSCNTNIPDGNALVNHKIMDDLPDLIEPGTLMVFNNSRVRRSRCYGLTTDTGREVEFLFLQQVAFDTHNTYEPGRIWIAMVKNAKKLKPGKKIVFNDNTTGEILDEPLNEGTEFRSILFNKVINEQWFETNGHIPLPPYIKREDTKDDSERYQNVYAKETGSTACPTAGLHFTEKMLDRIAAKGIETAYVTLHVGLGTFLPVRVDNIEEHKMHKEFFTINDDTAKKINKAKQEGRTILAVGTTSVRTLESAWCGDNIEKGGYLQSGSHSTEIFIYPGYKFKCVDRLFTNFHTPESTLMMLVSAFAGRENIMKAYKSAVENRYHFFSYGDAMLIK